MISKGGEQPGEQPGEPPGEQPGEQPFFVCEITDKKIVCDSTEIFSPILGEIVLAHITLRSTIIYQVFKNMYLDKKKYRSVGF